MSGKMYVPLETCRLGDYPNMFVKNQTRVREGHPVLKQFGHMFREAEAEYEWPDVEQATAAPGERRRAKVKA
jgi:hypothetical protein